MGEGKLKSCFPTALLNALIYLGVISKDEAEHFQHNSELNVQDIFRVRNFGETSTEVITIPSGKILEILQKELNIDFESKTAEVSKFSEPELIQYIQESLSKGFVLVGGDGKHAVVIAGYSTNENGMVVFNIIDGYKPISIKQIDGTQLASNIKEELYVTLIRSVKVSKKVTPRGI